MLLRFGVRNYRSISEYQELLLTASRLGDSRAGLLHSEKYKLDVLPAIAIYGGNASGKTTLLRAMNFLRTAVQDSHSAPESARIARRPYKLGNCSKPETSQFDIDFIADEAVIAGQSVKYVRFTYGFEVSDDSVVEEWLFAYPHGHKQVWFHRKSDEANEFYFGKELKGQNKQISKNTRKDALYLSTAFANNHEQLAAVSSYLTTHLLVKIDPLDGNDSVIHLLLKHEKLRKKILHYIKSADIGICGAEVVERPSVRSELGAMVDDLKKVMEQHLPGRLDELTSRLNVTTTAVQLSHLGADGPVKFDLEDESRGTLSYLSLMGRVLIALATGATLIIDEFDSSLHPLLCRKIVELFNNSDTNNTNAQIVFTTHDTTLLSLDLLRRDQVWFTEKDNQGSTAVFPLTDLKIRKNDNVQRGYLEGRFGAIPFLTFMDQEGTVDEPELS